jgi:membrane-associated PAP2 superfamily phosphatase
MVEEQRTVSTTRYAESPVTRDSVVTVRRAPTAVTMLRRVVMFLFGLVQLVVILRIIGLLINANADNTIVRFIYDASTVFVAPFEGILNTNALHTGGSVLDMAAVVALVGWSVLEALVLAGIGILDREP